MRKPNLGTRLAPVQRDQIHRWRNLHIRLLAIFGVCSCDARLTQPVFMAGSAATQSDTRIPARDNHTVVSDGENHTHTQIEGCSALGSKGGGYRRDRMRNSPRRHHSDVYSTYLLCSRRRCVEGPSRSAWGRSADHSKESNSPSLTLLAVSQVPIGIHRRYRDTAYRRPRSGKRISPTHNLYRRRWDLRSRAPFRAGC